MNAFLTFLLGVSVFFVFLQRGLIGYYSIIDKTDTDSVSGKT